jgi:hypothetical protein
VGCSGGFVRNYFRLGLGDCIGRGRFCSGFFLVARLDERGSLRGNRFHIAREELLALAAPVRGAGAANIS